MNVAKTMTFDAFCVTNQVDATERRELLLYLAFLRFRALFGWLAEEVRP